MAKSKPTKMLAVLGRCRRGGRWQPAARSSVLAVLGDCHLDMRKAIVDEEQPVKFQVTVFLGAVTFIVPPGVEIRPSGMSILASSQVAVPTADEPSFPLIEVEWTCILGRVRIIAAESPISEQAVIGGAGVEVPVGAAIPQGMVMPGVAQPITAVGQPITAVGQPIAAAGQPIAAVGQPIAAVGQPALAPAATAPAGGVGFENIGADPSPYGAAPAIPTLSEAMAAVPQAEPIPEMTIGAPEPEPEIGGFLDFGSDADSDPDDDGDDTDSADPDSDDADSESAATTADGEASKGSKGSGPASLEIGFVDILAAAG